jgi:hypothetical protein
MQNAISYQHFGTVLSPLSESITIFGKNLKNIKNIKFSYRNTYLENVSEFKFLGNVITQNGNLVSWPEALSKKALKVMYSIKSYTSNLNDCNLLLVAIPYSIMKICSDILEDHLWTLKEQVDHYQTLDCQYMNFLKIVDHILNL